jgi:hypothetical protein
LSNRYELPTLALAPQSSRCPTMVLMTLIVGSVMVNGQAWNKWVVLARSRAKVVVASTTTPDSYYEPPWVPRQSARRSGYEPSAAFG